ncbi:MAG: hypothetical protein HC921_20230 [Synechococcaceae cyanobacterium SM2_3_1]|nr:hypothetical protein [Synechococcaceae cyanobacterium SM2_3_1]
MAKVLSELIDFLQHRLRMVEVYQPVILLHLLKHDGVAKREELALALAGSLEEDLSFWDRVLMDAPKRCLQGQHNLIFYDKETRYFYLNFEMTDFKILEQAKKICLQKIEEWILPRITAGADLVQVEQWRNVLAMAQAEVRLAEVELNVDAFAMSVARSYMRRWFPAGRVVQQEYLAPGRDLEVVHDDEVIVYVKVCGTRRLVPRFWLREVDRTFAEKVAERFMVMLIFGIRPELDQYQMRVQRSLGSLRAVEWQISWWEGKADMDSEES